MLGDLFFASCETVAYRSLMMAQGTCSPAEYRRMVREKAQAASLSGLRLMFPGRGGVTAMLTPWHRRATANAKRLRSRHRRK